MNTIVRVQAIMSQLGVISWFVTPKADSEVDAIEIYGSQPLFNGDWVKAADDNVLLREIACAIIHYVTHQLEKTRSKERVRSCMRRLGVLDMNVKEDPVENTVYYSPQHDCIYVNVESVATLSESELEGELLKTMRDAGWSLRLTPPEDDNE